MSVSVRMAGRGGGAGGGIIEVLDANAIREFNEERNVDNTSATAPHGLVQVLQVFRTSSRTYLYATALCCTQMHATAV